LNNVWSDMTISIRAGTAGADAWPVTRSTSVSATICCLERRSPCARRESAWRVNAATAATP